MQTHPSPRLPATRPRGTGDLKARPSWWGDKGRGAGGVHKVAVTRLPGAAPPPTCPPCACLSCEVGLLRVSRARVTPRLPPARGTASCEHARGPREPWVLCPPPPPAPEFLSLWSPCLYVSFYSHGHFRFRSPLCCSGAILVLHGVHLAASAIFWHQESF